MKINVRLMRVSRLLHIYLSVILLLILVFFSLTGIVLNHPEWFAAQSGETALRGEYAGKILSTDPTRVSTASAGGMPLALDKHFRAFIAERFGIDTERASVERDANSLFIDQQQPGRSISLEVDMDSGAASAIITDYGLIARLADLHKGRHARRLWLWLLDFSAVLVVLFSLTGLLILLPQKRRIGKVLLYALLGLPLFLIAAL